MSSLDNYLNGDTLTPITAAACDAIAKGANKADLLQTGPTPSRATVSALVDAVAALEAAVIALQGS
jgi:hypothetical protein